MASSHRPVHPRPARAVRRHPFTRLLVVGFFCGFGYAGLTNTAFGPGTDLADAMPADVELVSASLSYSGAEPVITGSVGHLFDSFTGPNRAEKTDRQRPPVDALAISRSFEEVRIRLAALRTGPADPTEPGQSRVAETASDATTDEVETGPRMTVAAIDAPSVRPLSPANAPSVRPPAATDVPSVEPRMSVAAIDAPSVSALKAIDGIAPPSQRPMPVVASEQLAYARSNAPATGAFATGNAIEVSDKEMWCLATAIYFEARGESYRGQVAVAQVVLNRVKDHRYPDTICGVVFQNQAKRNACQFSFACDGIPDTTNDRKSWAQAQDIAGRFTSGQLYLTEIADSTHYHATYVRPAWAPRMTKVTQIGLHVFYKFKRGWLFG